uniref:Uncharacterized protein n=1 Tax=Rhizophagus irregularis (strain DAOM 181602 / DAOM 197198 / MUCL 43194) TaxID=747089 RepID=U9UWL9_RHIID
MSLTQQSERAYKGRDCKNGHKFGTSCLILGNQKGYEGDCKNGTTSALRASPGNQKAGHNNAYHTRPLKVTQKLLESDRKVPGTGKELKHMIGAASDSCDLSIIGKLSTSSFKRPQNRMKPITGSQDIPPKD